MPVARIIAVRQALEGPVQYPVLWGSEFNGFAGKDSELSWSTPADWRKMGKPFEAPSGGSPRPGPMGPDSLLVSHRGLLSCPPSSAFFSSTSRAVELHV